MKRLSGINASSSKRVLIEESYMNIRYIGKPMLRIVGENRIKSFIITKANIINKSVKRS